jgi:hypothetical protein
MADTGSTALSAEAQTMLERFKALDPDAKGIGLHQLRILYPRIGWGVIMPLVNELVKAKAISRRRTVNRKGTSAGDFYIWKQV